MGKHELDCWCDTCKRQVTIAEVKSGAHSEHKFAPEERAALEAVSQYLETIPDSQLE
jgi:hypothetical protein